MKELLKGADSSVHVAIKSTSRAMTQALNEMALGLADKTRDYLKMLIFITYDGTFLLPVKVAIVE